MSSHVIGIDIGGTKLATVVADKDGEYPSKGAEADRAREGTSPCSAAAFRDG